MPKNSILQTFLQYVDRLSEGVGKVFAWLIVFLVLALVYEVAARYFFAAPTIWAWDLSYMLYGAHFMMGAAYVLSRGGNVRIDVFYNRFSPRWKAIVDLCLYPVLFFPVVIALVVWGTEQALHSWEIRELTLGLWRAPLYPLRILLPVGAFLLLLQGIVEFIRNLSVAINRDNA